MQWWLFNLFRARTLELWHRPNFDKRNGVIQHPGGAWISG